MELNFIYKIGNQTSHEEGLRLVYEKGRYDQRIANIDKVQEPTLQDLSGNPVEAPVATENTVDQLTVTEDGTQDPPQVPV